MYNLHPITTCTKAKAKAGGCLHEYQDYQYLEQLTDDWIRASEKAGAEESLPAGEMYKGPHWSFAKSLQKMPTLNCGFCLQD